MKMLTSSVKMYLCMLDFTLQLPKGLFFIVTIFTLLKVTSNPEVKHFNLY